MSSHRKILVQLPPWSWVAIGALFLAPWIALVMVLRPARPAEGRRAPPPPAPVSRSEPATTLRPGPWGKVDYFRILIEPPEDFISEYYTTPQPLRWVLPNYTEAMLDALWASAALSPEQRTALSSASRREPFPEGIALRPEPAAVFALSPEARSRIYSALASFPENRLQMDPFRTRAELLEEWFDESLVPAEAIALTRQLLYPRGALFLFSDPDLVLPRIARTADRIHFIKNLSRKSSLLAQLHVEHGADIDGLDDYWGRGHRSKDVRPILQSLARRPNGGSIDIVHLLPQFARSLLYTFPVPSSRANDANHDCHWTSLNFFNLTPDEGFADLAVVQQTLMRDYLPVDGPPLLGDILVLVTASGKAVHSCVHVADDIVFTKNGASFSTPWQLAQLENIVAFYSHAERLTVHRYRSRAL